MEKENIILLLETIERSMSTKPIMEMEVSVPKTGDFYIEIYNPANTSEKEFITKNRQFIKDFFDAGYEAAGLGEFLSCRDAKSLKRNTVLLKVGREKTTGKIIAMSIYNEHPSGIKCAGMTRIVTTDEALKTIANAALVHIIKEDISHFKDYYWIECSGAIKHWWEKNGGIKIPNTYLPAVFAAKPEMLEKVRIEPGEEYDYYRVIGEEHEEKKCIFGFSNKQVLEKYLEDRNISLDDMIKKYEEKNKVDESVTVDAGKIQTDIDIMKYCIMEQLYDIGIMSFEITEYEERVFHDAISRMENYVRKYANMLPQYECNKLVNQVEAAYYAANLFSILKPYQFGDEFICERELYPEDFSYDEHERRYL